VSWQLCAIFGAAVVDMYVVVCALCTDSFVSNPYYMCMHAYVCDCACAHAVIINDIVVCLKLQDITTSSVTGVDGAFMPPTRGTSQALVSNAILLLHLHLAAILISIFTG